MYHHNNTKNIKCQDVNYEEIFEWHFLQRKRIIILLVLVIVAVILSRLAVRAFMNLMLGGTLFGGNFL